MNIIVSKSPNELGIASANAGIQAIENALANRGRANIIVATGTSQFATLEQLTATDRIDWSQVVGFHLDEYLGLSDQHPASFRGYLRDRFVNKLPLAAFHYVDGESPDANAECARLGALIEQYPIDVAFVGIGENGHLAFNDPPADLETTRPYLVVDLDQACRQQQFGEGWFDTLDDVPTRAISMSCQQILKSKTIICSVPDQRKAKAVQETIEGPVTPQVPASILQTHADTTLFLDEPAASHLSESH